MKIKPIKSILFSKVVFIRHGESIWNKENRFTGWHDVPLSENGILESIKAGETIKKHSIKLDIAFTSILKRTITCFNHIAEILDIHHIPVYKSYRLNERHYGALQGLNKAEMIKKYGAEKIKLWTRSYNIQPPKINRECEHCIHGNLKYPPGVLPLTEVFFMKCKIIKSH